MLDFFKREHWNHDCISARAVTCDWDELRGEDREGVEVILPPITAEILDQYDAAPEEFDAEDWLADHLIDYTTGDQDDQVYKLAEAEGVDPWDWRVENWRTFLTPEQITEIEANMAEAKEEALEEAKENFDGSPDYYEWTYSFEPAMNYYWPVELAYGVKPKEVAARIDRYAGATALVYISSADTYAIVLTGGGMDLSWDICAAYICCGCVPPSRLLLNLPRITPRFPDLIVNTMLPLLAEHFNRLAENARIEALRLAEYLSHPEG